MKIIGLRIDVDTLRGTSRGVPALCEVLSKHGVKGTFYFSVGPDNMGRHLWRLLKPAFLWKMLRTNAAGLYGPEIVLMGTAWPGIKIGKRCETAIKMAVDGGHEIGFHAWDHHRSQSKIDRMTSKQVYEELERGVNELTRITGCPPVSSATPGWRTNDTVLLEKLKFPFLFDSDCRGTHPFYPVVNGQKLDRLQIPVTLPTYDEIAGEDGVTDENYNDKQLALLREDAVNVLTIHAEAEGGRCMAMFDEYLTKAKAAGYHVVPLGEIAREFAAYAPEGQIKQLPFPGREGWLAVQV